MKKRRWLPWIFFLAIYVANFFVASLSPGFSFEQALGSFVIFGIFFSSVAYFLVRKYTTPFEDLVARKGELVMLSALFILVSVSLIYGDKIFTAWLPAALQDSMVDQQVITLIRKLVVFVLLPFALYYRFFGFKWKDFGLSWNRKDIFSWKNAIVFIVMAFLFFVLQWFGGRGAEPIRAGEYNFPELAIGMPIVFLWLFIEVGLVEEFFFRALLQERIAALTKSPAWGIVIACLLFGLAHAPGMYFREAGVIEGLGTNPSFITTISYCIAVQATAGLPFAIIWSKTKNLWLVMAIHASVDLFSNYPELMNAFGF